MIVFSAKRMRAITGSHWSWMDLADGMPVSIVPGMPTMFFVSFMAHGEVKRALVYKSWCEVI